MEKAFSACRSVEAGGNACYVAVSKPGPEMRFSKAVLLAACLVPLSLGSAAAEGYAGQDVTVNPLAASRGVLLYPGGQYARIIHPLLEPGEKPADLGPIHLHMPAAHAAATAKREPAETAPARPRREARIAPPPVVAPPPVARPQPPKAKVARAEPAPAIAPPSAPPAGGEFPLTPGLTKRSVILFAPDATDPAKSALGAIKFLAQDLNSAMTSPSARIQLLAYGGPRGNKDSDARRLSLKRALSIRQVLIDDGVAADRIDVHAGGGVDDSGPADRVDVYVKT